MPRKALWQAALASKCDWLFWLDADMIPASDPRYLEARDVLYVLEQKKERALRLETRALRLAGKLLDICFEDAGIKKNGEDEARRLLVE